MCLVSFAAFLHFSELANLKKSGGVVYEDHMELFVEKSKTDQYRH